MNLEWISVDKDLPADDVDVIVHYSSVDSIGEVCQYFNIGRRIGAAYFGEIELVPSYWDIEFTGIDNRVLHWMHLPPVPKNDNH